MRRTRTVGVGRPCYFWEMLKFYQDMECEWWTEHRKSESNGNAPTRTTQWKWGESRKSTWRREKWWIRPDVKCDIQMQNLLLYQFNLYALSIIITQCFNRVNVNKTKRKIEIQRTFEDFRCANAAGTQHKISPIDFDVYAQLGSRPQHIFILMVRANFKV